MSEIMGVRVKSRKTTADSEDLASEAIRSGLMKQQKSQITEDRADAKSVVVKEEPEDCDLPSVKIKTDPEDRVKMEEMSAEDFVKSEPSFPDDDDDEDEDMPYEECDEVRGASNSHEEGETLRKRTREDSLEKHGERVSRNRRNSGSSCSTTSSGMGKRSTEVETDPVVLARRQKEIDYGKNTIGYDIYSSSVPKDKRSKEDPQTPPKYAKYSRRGWDGMVRLWRKQLHKWDPAVPNGTEEKTDNNPSSA